MMSLEMFGTELRLSIESLNMGPELQRIGLSFSYGNRSIWIEEGPTLHANLANRLGVGAAISRHLSAGGICLAWPIANNEVQWMEITPRGVQEISDPRRQSCP